MGKYLDIIARMDAEEARTCDQSDISDQRYIDTRTSGDKGNQPDTFGRLCRFGRTLSELERRCPAHVEPGRWHQAIEDGKRFLAEWGDQAEALGWTARDLFGLHEVPANPLPSYRRLSRYDCTGLIWFLQGSPVVALAATAAAIRMPTGTNVTYRKRNKPAFGPLGDSLDGFVILKGNLPMTSKVGTGSLRSVEPKTEKHPSYKGSVTIGGAKYWLSGWNRTGDDGSTYLSLSVDQSDGEAQPAPRKNDAPF